MNEVAIRIKKELEKKGMSQKELCNITKISESAMSKYLSNNISIRSDVLAKISKALGVSMYALMGIQEKEEDTFNVCKTALLARSGTKLTNDEKKELIDLIFGHD